MAEVDVGKTLQLVRSAQGGDSQSLERLLQRYSPRVQKIVRLQLGNKLRSRMDSADVLQEVLVAAVRSFDNFEMRDEASLIHWFGKIVRHKILAAAEHEGAQRRSQDREVAMEGPDNPNDSMEVYSDPMVDTLVPLDKAIRLEERDVVEQCIAELPEKYRELILMRNYSGMAFAQIAEETDNPTEGAARMKHAKAMIELARRVKAKLSDA